MPAETQIHMEMERTEEIDDLGNATISVQWKEGQSEHVVAQVGATGHAAPRRGDRLIKINGVVRIISLARS
jgi:hypothetical protein